MVRQSCSTATMRVLAVTALMLTACSRGTVRPPEQFSQPLQGLMVRVQEYVEQRRQIVAHVPALKADADATEIKAHEQAVLDALRAARKAARQGDIIDAAAATELRRILHDIPRSSLRDAEPKPVTASLQVNAVYPAGEPLATMPPSVLSRLPPLPEELQFRIVNGALVLLDWQSLLIVDFVRDVVSS